MTSFSALKSNSAAELDKLTEALTKLDSNTQNKQNGPDDRIWKPTVDKAGNGYAVIRFLPAPADEDVPFVESMGPRIPRTSRSMVYREISYYYWSERSGF